MKLQPMLHWLRPPQIEDEYERVVYASLHYSLLLFIFITTAMLTQIRDPLHIFLNPAAVGSLIASYILLQKRRFQLAGMLFLGSVWLLITISFFELDGVHNISVPV